MIDFVDSDQSIGNNFLLRSFHSRPGITKLGSPDAQTPFFKTLSMIIEASSGEASTSSNVANNPPGMTHGSIGNDLSLDQLKLGHSGAVGLHRGAIANREI